MKIQSRLEIESPELLKEVKKFIKEKDQNISYCTSLGIVKQAGNVFYSSKNAFDLLWKLSFYFNQSGQSTPQCGDIALTNRDGLHNKDTKVINNCGLHQCWFNGCVSTRLGEFSRAF